MKGKGERGGGETLESTRKEECVSEGNGRRAERRREEDVERQYLMLLALHLNVVQIHRRDYVMVGPPQSSPSYL